MKKGDFVVIQREGEVFNKKGKILKEELIDETFYFEVYVPKDESIYFLRRDEVSSNKKEKANTKIPNKKRSALPLSRKDLYSFISNNKVEASSIVDTLEALSKEGSLNFLMPKDSEDPTEDTVIKLAAFIHQEGDRQLVINRIRSLRDENKIEFNLPNNSFQIVKKGKKKYTKKKKGNL